MSDIYEQGVVRRMVTDLRPGDRVDLQNDPFADPDGLASSNDDASTSQHPEFEFEFEVVLAVVRETDDYIRVDFESGFSCGFPPDHAIEVDGEQIREVPSFDSSQNEEIGVGGPR